MTAHERARREARAALEEARAEIGEVRAERDKLNDRIRLLDAQVITLASVVDKFDRRAPAEADAAKPIRRGKPAPS